MSRHSFSPSSHLGRDASPAGEGAPASGSPAPLPRLCAHLGYQFNEVPLAERFAAAADTGFAAVEHPQPYELPVESIRAQLDAHRLTYVQLALPQGDRARGEKGIGCHPGRETEKREFLARAIAYAKALGCGLVHPMAGAVPAGVDRETAMQVYVEHLAECADALAREGLTALVEFLNARDMAGYLIDSPQAALDAIARCGRPNVRMLVDTYHFAVVGADTVAFVEENLARIGHIQIADHPGRHEPGTGTLDFNRLFETLDTIRYPGWVGCEYVPAGNTRVGLAWRERFRPRSTKEMP